MGLRIATNVASLAAQRNLSAATDQVSRNFERLATGRRIARASDDAAGLGISARLRSQVRSLDVAARNAQDGISLLTVAESGLVEIENSLLRMRELAVQAQNGTLSSNDRVNLQAEFSQLQSAINQIANGAEFNNISLLNAETAITLQVGPDTTASVDTLIFSTVAGTTAALSLTPNGVSIGSAASASAAVVALDAALETITSSRGTLGAVQNRLDATLSALRARSENLQAANSRIFDVDIASETARLTQNSILQQAAISVLAQANVQPQAALSLLG